jgi:DNA polymerase V
VASFAARAAERARRHELKAGALRVVLGWRENGAPAADDAAARLPPTNDTTALTRAAKTLAARLFVEGRAYRKAGVVLGALEDADSAQAEFFDDGRGERSRRLLRAVDGLNAALGAGTLRYAGEASAAWAPHSANRSPRWTTNWDELPRARA